MVDKGDVIKVTWGITCIHRFFFCSTRYICLPYLLVSCLWLQQIL